MIDVDAAGTGLIEQDDFGLEPLYVATHAGFSFVANRPDLIAFAWHRVFGRPPKRDFTFGALLAFKGYPMGDRTGYREVRCVPFFASLRISPDGVQIVDFRSPPWLSIGPTQSITKGDLRDAIDEVEALLIDGMRLAVASVPSYAGRPAIQLTGGRDSRLSIALALRGGIIDDLDAITFGRPGTADARIASEVAESADNRHSLHPWPPATQDLPDHVRRTTGALSAREPCQADPRFRQAIMVSGLLGETFRTNYPTTEPLCSRSQVLRSFLGQPNLDLLTEMAWIDTMAEALQLLMSPLDSGAKPEDLQDAFYLQHRIRRWISVRPDVFRTTYVPLYCPRAVQLAFASGWRFRADNQIHDAIVARAGHGLSHIPYAAGKQPRRPWRSTMNYPESGPPVRDRRVLRQIAQSWRRQRPRSRLPETPTGVTSGESAWRIDLYRQIIDAKRDNAAFHVIDKQRLLSAVGALSELRPHLANQVHGAMTSVIWLGELESELRLPVRRTA